MKYPEYDSPFELTISDITTQVARNIDEACWQAIQRVGINVDKEKMLIALKQDAERYREAFLKGHDAGYEKRDDEIIRCKDCEHGRLYEKNCVDCELNELVKDADWFCADGERGSSDG